MNLNSVREEAIEATARFFWDRGGLVPDQDSEEWEAEYRRQFDIARKRHESGRPVIAEPGTAAAPPAPTDWAVLTGAPTQVRWAAALRSERLKEIGNREIRDWLATTWTKAKSWIDTRELPTATFLERIKPHFAEYRRHAEEQARTRTAEQQAKDAAAAEIRRQIEAAGITADGLMELIDIAERLPAAPIKAKVTELAAGDRHLRVFETGDPAVLMVLEKTGSGRSEYGIERDEGLVADLRLFARSLELT